MALLQIRRMESGLGEWEFLKGDGDDAAVVLRETRHVCKELVALSGARVQSQVLEDPCNQSGVS